MNTKVASTQMDGVTINCLILPPGIQIDLLDMLYPLDGKIAIISGATMQWVRDNSTTIEEWIRAQGKV